MLVKNVKPIWDDLIKIKISMTLIFSISNFKKMFGVFKDDLITHLFLCVKYYIYVCNLCNFKFNLLGTQLISRVTEKLNIVLLKRGGNFFFAIPFYFMGQYNVFSTLTRLFIVYISDSVTLNVISCDNCCKIFYVCCYCNLM